MTEDLHLWRPLRDGGPEPIHRQPFGSAADDFWILDGGRITWEIYQRELGTVFAKETGTLIVFYQPWWPGSEAKRMAFRKEFQDATREFNGSVLVTVSAGELDRIFSVHKTCGGHNSGLWLLASPRLDANRLLGQLVAVGGFGSPLLVLLPILDEVCAALTMDEGAWTSLLVRRTHPDIHVVEDLYRRMQQDDLSESK